MYNHYIMQKADTRVSVDAEDSGSVLGFPAIQLSMVGGTPGDQPQPAKGIFSTSSDKARQLLACSSAYLTLS